MTQLIMTGEDWLSDRDRKAQARAKAARKAAKALQDAAEAVSEFKFACLECGDGSATLRADDGLWSATCSKCGTLAMSHSLRTAP